jgi:hypothetical protein
VVEIRDFKDTWVFKNPKNPYAKMAMDARGETEDFMGNQLACIIAEVAVKRLFVSGDLHDHSIQVQKCGMEIELAVLRRYADDWVRKWQWLRG